MWTPAQLRQVLGDDDGAWAADLFGVTETGTFEAGTCVLRLARDIDQAAPECGPGGRTYGPGCSKPGRRDPNRRGTTRSWRPGTGWR